MAEQKETRKHYSFADNWHFYWGIVFKTKPGLIAAIIGIAISETLLNVGTIVLPTLVVQLLTQKSSLPYFATVIISIVVGITVTTVLHGLVDIYGTDRSTAPRMRMANYLNSKIMAIDYQLLENPDTQQLFDAATRNGTGWTLAGGQAFYFGVEGLTRDILTLLVLLITISFFTPLIFVLLVFSGLISYLMLQRYRRWYAANHHTRDELQRKQKYLSQNAYAIENGKDVRLYQMSAWYHQHFEENRQQLNHWQQKQSTTQLVSDLISDFATLVRDGFAYLYLAFQIIAKNITATQLTLFFTTMSQFSQLVSQFIEDLNTLQKASVDLQEVRQFLDLPQSDTTSQLTTAQRNQLKQQPMTIQFDQVTYCYPKATTATIKNLSFKIDAGQKLALVGANGAGKTTITQLMMGLLKPTSGRVLINQVETSALTTEEQFALFAPVFQDSIIMALTLAQNISMSIEPDEKRIWQILKEVGLVELVEKLPQKLSAPMTRYIDSDGIEFSGGQIQKLMLARALYKNAPILILDEPTAALDPIAENEMYRQYAAMTFAKTSLFISHRLSSTRFCDNILYLDHGELHESGTHEELMALHGEYAHVYEVQSKYYQTQDPEQEVAK
ncbi:ABC transporter ATP-binding protein [Lapidilactobacillus mulanensis]|uniref:ABC transporter ATP-binding protein n=1 Tax=Lapidilactobacillus mulanensis TaxID=2485999 RepID=A0ABW4DPG1_9LACO|nr:ABC transporter ATP-binding protein [Lapidilactobacillus mulanensis]